MYHSAQSLLIAEQTRLETGCLTTIDQHEKLRSELKPEATKLWNYLEERKNIESERDAIVHAFLPRTQMVLLALQSQV